MGDAEHRARMFQIGHARREAGLRRWERTVDIKQYIHGEYSEDKIVNAFNVIRNVSEVIRTQMKDYLDVRNEKYDVDFAELVEEMTDRTVEGFRDSKDAVELVDFYLSEVYDFFDYNHIWAGDPGRKVVKLNDVGEASSPRP